VLLFCVVRMPGKKKKKKKEEKKLTVERVEKAFEKLAQMSEEVSMEIDSVKRFVREVLNIFITDTRFIKDQLLLLAHRLAELEEMAQDFIRKHSPGSPESEE